MCGLKDYGFSLAKKNYIVFFAVASFADVWVEIVLHDIWQCDRMPHIFMMCPDQNITFPYEWLEKVCRALYERVD